jgi:DNA-binding response OmpR family regulator
VTGEGGRAAIAAGGFKLLLVEDDSALASQVAAGLGRWGYDVAISDGSGDVFADFVREKPRLAILDVNLPRYDGFHWCRRIREVSTVPVLFLSARSEGMDAVMGMSLGGDDYLTKPFSMDLLVAKVGALLRRAYSYAEAEGELFERAGALLDLGRSRLERDGEGVDLTRNELRILTTLMRKPGSLVPKAEVIEALWNDEVFVDENTLNVAMNRLRKKLGSIGLEGFIVTRKGEGYLVP